jgi:hypothetical protein
VSAADVIEAPEVGIGNSYPADTFDADGEIVSDAVMVPFVLPPRSEGVGVFGGSGPSPSEPGGALDRGIWIVARRDWRWLRSRPRHLGWCDADAHNDPISVTLARDPARTGLSNPPPFDLSDRLFTCHPIPLRCRRIVRSLAAPDCGVKGAAHSPPMG